MSREAVLGRDAAEEWLYLEAHLLDEGEFHGWLDLLSEEIHYWMGCVEFVQGKKSAFDEPEDGGYALFDDDKESLRLRVARLDTGLARAESPPSVTQRLITNVRVDPRSDDTMGVHSAFMVTQARQFGEQSVFVGRRKDTLVRSDGGFLLADRKIYLANIVLPRTLSIFF